MNIVIDTNVFLISINPASRFNPIFRKAISGKFNLCVSNSILLEYEEILKFRVNTTVAEAALSALIYSPFVLRVDPRISWRLITADPDDDKFTDCAIAANADYLVTNDRHFEVLRKTKFPRLSILTAEEFLEKISE